jgi:hypothetical protein
MNIHRRLFVHNLLETEDHAFLVEGWGYDVDFSTLKWA